ncbi:hypothetical protein [Pilimelia terevasa]|uniref:hypothetical protein n=1 Tax=Pilimelia terevasa TaxID=53372 RepID=UPI00166BD6E7|nr:hypothetical protein [Pilimelia terevasa]
MTVVMTGEANAPSSPVGSVFATRAMTTSRMVTSWGRGASAVGRAEAPRGVRGPLVPRGRPVARYDRDMQNDLGAGGWRPLGLGGETE